MSPNSLSSLIVIHSASSYVDADGTLNAELEVKLQQTNVLDTNCIIC